MHRHRLIRRRPLVQLAAAALFNGYAAGFTGKKLFTGRTKAFCVPVLNCYSCPGALGACPIGALQAVLNHRRFPFYVLGTLTLFGVLLGRLICGFLCPFGFLQDLLNKIPHPALKLKGPFGKKADKAGRLVKYAVLVVLVVLLPAFAANENGVLPPYFCKYVCPAGTLEGGIFQLLLQPELRRLAGALFDWKLGILITVVVLSVFIPRFFCRYLCPLGAFYSLFNRFSFYTMKVDRAKCVGCEACTRGCPMNVDVRKNINSAECIRCGKCVVNCPTDAISASFTLRPNDRPASPEG